MHWRVPAAIALSVAFHLLILYGPGRGQTGVAEAQAEAVDVILVAETAPPPPPPPATVAAEETPPEDELVLPDEFLGAGLAEPPPSAVSVDVLSQFVRPEAPRPPRPEGMRTLGIPTGAQRASGAAGAKVELVFSLEDLDRIPAVRYEATPVYPPDLRRSSISGEVDVLLIVDASGRVANATVQFSSNPGFEESALRAAYKWRFEPGIRNGSPVSFKMLLPLKYRINR
jgi:protein TonB